MLRPAWRYELIRRTLKPLLALAPLTKLPFFGLRLHRQLLDKDAGRVIPINQSVSNFDNIVLPSEIVRRLIDRAGRRWLMNECLCRAAHHCSNYPVKLGCIFLGSATETIPQKLGREVARTEALEHLEKCEAAGLVHLVGHFRLDAMVLDATPFTSLLSICNCCECCCIFKIMPQVHSRIGSSLKGLDGVTVKVGNECRGCGTCTEACFVEAISLTGSTAQISDQCRGCGRCVRRCPNEAITLTISESDYVDRAVEKLSGLANICS